jgi:hypothetical protein
LLVSGEVYLWLRLLVMMVMLLLMLLNLVVVMLLLCLGVLLLLSEPPALHHWVLGSGSLPQAMICLYGCNVSSRVGLRGMYLIDGDGPGLASVVLLGSRVKIVG